ncbi:MAG: orotidine 5'-phosphate decarboxylase / HUMPS family protein [Candidatus Babeliales bacterium]
MKVQISFDLIDLDKSLEIAKKVEPYIDTFEISSLLLFKYGLSAIEKFKETFPKKTILADAKIVDCGKQTVTMLVQAGAQWITVMAGTNTSVIHSACTTAENLGAKIMLDLLDAASPGQSALEAKSMGVSALLVHRSYEDEDPLKFIDAWDMVRGNSNLPIYVSGKIERSIVDKINSIKPDGIVISKAITHADDPAKEAQFFKEAFSS